jgi:transglutaminase-like putative cysteine protease
MRRTVAVTVILAWAAAMGWLAVRTIRAPARAAEREDALAVTPGAAYYTLHMDTTLVGFASVTLDTSVTAVRLSEVVDLRLPDGDTLLRVMLRGETELSRGLRLRSFAYQRTVSGRRTAVRGTTIGDSLLVWQVGQEKGVSTPDTVRLPTAGLQTPGTLPLTLIFAGRLRAGAARAYPVTDPLDRQVRLGSMVILRDSTFVVPDSSAKDTVTERVVAARWDTVQAWLVERRGLGAPTTTWIDTDGLPVAGELYPGITMERQPFEVAAYEYRDRIAAKFPDMPRPVGHVRLTRAPAPVARLGVRLAGVLADSAGWARAGLTGGRQRLALDTLLTGDDAGAPDTTARALADGLVPGADTAVAALARRVLKEERDPSRVVRRLAQWTASELAGDIEAELPDVRHALTERAADPSARAAIFSALARAAGVPARPVAGLVADGPQWRRHAWAEVRVDGRWTPVDPALGTWPAHGGYVRLLTDAPADPVLLIPLAHRLAPGAPLRQGRP